MTKEELTLAIEKICPEMLKHDNFIKHAINRYCNGEFVDVKALSDEEYKAWLDVHEVVGTATVGQLVKYLKENFKLDDKLCYMDCVEGLKNDCTYVTKKQLGERFFYYVSKLKSGIAEDSSSMSKNDVDNLYPYVKDNDVVVC